MSDIKELFNYIPKTYFVTNLKDNRIGHIKLALVRETINPLVIRSTDAEATVTLVTDDGRELVEIPPRKLKSREKLLGLMMCRKFGVVHESVRYNSIEGAEYLNNPNSVLFGDTSTKTGDTAGLVSRAIYDWAYSLRDVKDVTDKLQHNALSEAGTMIDENTGKTKQTLFQTEYILPGTLFPHFITVDNVTPELLLHLLFAVMNCKRYGAQTTTNANNMENHLVAIGFGPFEKPINSYLISKQWREAQKDQMPTLAGVTHFVVEKMKEQYSENLIANNPSDQLAKFCGFVSDFWKSENRQALEGVYKTAAQNVDSYLRDIKLVGEDKDLKALKEALEALKRERKGVTVDAVILRVFKDKQPKTKAQKEREAKLRQLFTEQIAPTLEVNS
jgi:CRISPR-associated protein Csc2